MRVLSKVYADNIAEITNRYAWSHQGMTEAELPPPPDITTLATRIRQGFEARLAEEDSLDAIESLHYYRGVFEHLMAHVPEGFALAPMFYSCTDEERIEQARSTFAKEKRKDLLQWTAATVPEELKALGICDEGIRRMKEEKRAPRNNRGLMYGVNMDHVIDLAGCGRLLTEQESWINGKDNVCLLTLQVHDDYKNCLKMIQNMLSADGINERWLLTLAPARMAGRSGMVAYPQKQGHPFGGITLINTRLPNGVERMFNLVGAISSSLNAGEGHGFSEGRERHLKMSLRKLTSVFVGIANNGVSRKDRKALRLVYSNGGKKLFARLQNTHLPEAQDLLQVVAEVEEKRMQKGRRFKL